MDDTRITTPFIQASSTTKNIPFLPAGYNQVFTQFYTCLILSFIPRLYSLLLSVSAGFYSLSTVLTNTETNYINKFNTINIRIL